jgi:DNA end-binding protein Ku
MAQLRPIWRGHLRLALVSCPVALYSANHDRGSLRFHLINPQTGHRVRMVTQDAETGDELSRQDLVKGYEFKKNTYLILDDEDFERARIDSSSTMTIEKFVDAASIDPLYFEASYYAAPDGDTGKDVYAVLREAIAKSGKIALARVVIARRERAMAIMPFGKGLVAHSLHDNRDLNSANTVFDDIPADKPDPEMVKLATELIHRQTGRYDPSDVEDRYETRLREVINAKLKGEGIEVAEAEPEDRGNVIDLMAALKRSLGEDKPGRPTQPSPTRPNPAPSAKPAKLSAGKAKSPAAAAPKGPARRKA